MAVKKTQPKSTTFWFSGVTVTPCMHMQVVKGANRVSVYVLFLRKSFSRYNLNEQSCPEICLIPKKIKNRKQLNVPNGIRSAG